MSYQSRITIAILASLGLSTLNEATAQPVAPMRPTYGSYGGFFGYGRGNYFNGNNNFGFQNNQMLMQNMQLQQQLNMTNQNIANLQNFLLTGVNPNLPITGHGATFGYLGHWYGNSPTRGGGFGAGSMYSGGGSGMMGQGGMMGNRGGSGTAGSGVPLAPARPGAGGPGR